MENRWYFGGTVQIRQCGWSARARLGRFGRYSSQTPEHGGPCGLWQGLQDFVVSETIGDHFWWLCEGQTIQGQGRRKLY